MNAIIKTIPTVEPVSLVEAKAHLRLDSGSFADNISSLQSIAPGAHVIANNYTVHVGAGIEVFGYQAVVNLISGTNLATGTVDVKIQESNDNITYTDWTGGDFAQITTDGAGATEPDNATYEKAYTGTKKYIRTVAKVLLATCEFGTEVLRYAVTSTEDDQITSWIKTARVQAEGDTWRALITQTWEAYLDKWPTDRFIKLPFPPLQSVTSVLYYDADQTELTFADYIVDAISEPGKLVLKTDYSWPSGELYPVNGIKITFVCGYGATGASVPETIKSAMKLMITDLYENRGEVVIGAPVSRNQGAIDTLLATCSARRCV